MVLLIVYYLTSRFIYMVFFKAAKLINVNKSSYKNRSKNSVLEKNVFPAKKYLLFMQLILSKIA